MSDSNRRQANLPLLGVKVVDLGQYIAGPGAAMVLCELGADVIKVEPLSGDRARHIGSYGKALIRAYNRGKRSLAVDLRDPRGAEAVMRLISRSDVVIQNLRPGVVEKLGLGPLQVRERFPNVIYLSISGFGTRGPSRDRPGYDIAAQAESGLMSVTGEPARPPQKVGVPIVDSATAHLGAQAVLAALFRRERRGSGETIETSLLEVALHLQAPTWSEFLYGGPEPTQFGDGQPNNAPAADLVRTRDGYIVLSAYTEDHWARFCRLMGREELITDPRLCTNAKRVQNRAVLGQVLHECLAGMDSDDCVRLLGQNQIVAGVVRTYSQVLASADLSASGMLVEAKTKEGGPGYLALGLPYSLESVPRNAPSATPRVGADSDVLLAEVGYLENEVEALRAAGVIA